ncbi:hypothetical protein V5N11_027955 [Cardamine amara subsp. amara]|uniref:Uncharacterized protein n=1 Tax=Cardamine amara subsp. amara TaxID=228776 RepID=A0ABD1C5Q7_CARAN
MAKLEPVYADSFMESRKRKLNTCRGVPLPYLIRPRRNLPPFDTFGFYNDYLEDLSDDEGDDSSVVEAAAETSSLDKGNESNAMGYLLKDEKDEDYVVVDHVEATPNSQKERAGAIQMMELSKDTVDESESDNAGYNSDEWVVV